MSLRTRRVGAAFVFIYLVFDRLATALGSTRGEWGVVVAAVVLLLTLGAERFVSEKSYSQCARTIGLGAPGAAALAAAAALSAGLIAGLPLMARLTGASLEVRDGVAVLAIGMFAQGGVAEEAIFRGFMYRHLRQTRPFWSAACVAAVPFVMAHIPLFFSLAPAIAALSVGIAVALSFPLAWLFDRARGAIWPGAILHATIQGGIKVLVDDAPAFSDLALVWGMSVLMAPWVLFLLRE